MSIKLQARTWGSGGVSGTLGVLFKRQEFQQKESELAIVVTPRLVKPLARDVNVDALLPGRTEQRNPSVWGPWIAGGLSPVAPGFSR